MDEFPIAGDIASKISGTASTGRLVLPDYKRIKNAEQLLPIETALRTAFAGNFPAESMSQPLVVSEAMRNIAMFVSSDRFVLLLLLKNMNNLTFSTILLQHIYNKKGVFLDDPYPESEKEKKIYVITHILGNIINSDWPQIITFKDREKVNDDRNERAFDYINLQFNFKQELEVVDEKEGVTGDGAWVVAKRIMAAANEAIKLMINCFDRFVAENPGTIAYVQPGTDGMISFFESRVIPKINEIIEQTNQPRAVFPATLVVAINDIVYRFDRQLLLEGLQGMQYDDIYLLDETQRSYFVAAVQKYLIYLKIAGNPRHTTLQVDTAKKAPTTVVSFAIMYHFQNWKGGKNNKPRFL